MREQRNLEAEKERERETKMEGEKEPTPTEIFIDFWKCDDDKI